MFLLFHFYFFDKTFIFEIAFQFPLSFDALENKYALQNTRISSMYPFGYKKEWN